VFNCSSLCVSDCKKFHSEAIRKLFPATLRNWESAGCMHTSVYVIYLYHRLKCFAWPHECLWYKCYVPHCPCMQADSPPMRGRNQDLLYRPLREIWLWACTCKQEPSLYLRLSTKTSESMESVESFYKWLSNCFVAITSFHTVYHTSKGLTFFLKWVSRAFRKMGVVLDYNGAKHSFVAYGVTSHLETTFVTP